MQSIMHHPQRCKSWNHGCLALPNYQTQKSSGMKMSHWLNQSAMENSILGWSHTKVYPFVGRINHVVTWKNPASTTWGWWFYPTVYTVLYIHARTWFVPSTTCLLKMNEQKHADYVLTVANLPLERSQQFPNMLLSPNQSLGTHHLQKHMPPPPWPTQNLPEAPRAIGANNVVAPIGSRANHHGGSKVKKWKRVQVGTFFRLKLLNIWNSNLASGFLQHVYNK